MINEFICNALVNLFALSVICVTKIPSKILGSIKKHDYDITFETGPQEDAGTYSYVKIRMFNEKGEHSLIHVDRQEFEVGR